MDLWVPLSVNINNILVQYWQNYMCSTYKFTNEKVRLKFDLPLDVSAVLHEFSIIEFTGECVLSLITFLLTFTRHNNVE